MRPMFKSEDEGYTSQEAETIIGKSVKIEGTFNGEGNIIVEGEVEGNLKTNEDLIVKPGAKISADVEAANMKISGEIKGNIKCHGSLEITSTGNVMGDLETKILSIASGAVLKGQCQVEGASGSTFSSETETDDQE
ncbi:MAG: polymer-forming cytoskeletal protein [Patescibacteria group bacterium]